MTYAVCTKCGEAVSDLPIDGRILTAVALFFAMLAHRCKAGGHVEHVEAVEDGPRPEAKA